MVVLGFINTTLERIITDAGHAVGDGHRGQAAAAGEHIIGDAGHTIWYDKFRYLRILITIQMMCIIKRIVCWAAKFDTAPILHIEIRNNNFCQTAAVSERIRADACYTIWNWNRG